MPEQAHQPIQGGQARDGRTTILITHANPQDNTFARWLAARLMTAGYNPWVDVRSLKGGDDFWDKIEETLRHEAIKQIVVVSQHARKPGVKKELALGDYIGKQLGDPDFMIPIRIDDMPHGEFPPELLRRNALDALPTWASVLGPLLKSLEDANVPRIQPADGGFLRDLVEAQQMGRLAIRADPETLLSNWFTLTAMPKTLRFFAGGGTRDQFDRWLSNNSLPHVPFLGLAGTFCDPVTFAEGGDAAPKLIGRFWIPMENLLSGKDIDPFPDGRTARNHVVNLLRQHWDFTARRRGLQPFHFASGQTGWFFPDGLTDGRVKLSSEAGLKIDRIVSGKFKERRWHLCLVARPRLWPMPVLRIHANLVLSVDGRTPLPGSETQKLRKRLTRSWFNDKWRDLLLAGVGWLADGQSSLSLAAGEETLAIGTWPMTFDLPVSYDAEEARQGEESDDGEIELSDEFEVAGDSLDDDLPPEES